jgi:hypothetical protein
MLLKKQSAVSSKGGFSDVIQTWILSMTGFGSKKLAQNRPPNREESLDGRKERNKMANTVTDCCLCSLRFLEVRILQGSDTRRILKSCILVAQ